MTILNVRHGLDNYEVLVDDEDAEYIKNYPKKGIYIDRNKRHAFIRDKDKKFILLSRLILRYNGPLDVDHKNRNKLDNRKENLRLATRQQNMCNRGKWVDGPTKYKGIRFMANKWEVYICHNNKRMYVGRYLTEIEAAKAYNEIAIKLHGEFASLNAV